VLDGNPAPPLQKGAHPQFSAHVYWGQAAGWIICHLVCRYASPRPHCVRWGPSSNHLKRDTASLPHLLAHACCGQPAGWIKMPLDTKVGLSPGHVVLHGDPGAQPRNFRPMSIVAKRSPISATSEPCINCSPKTLPVNSASDFGK